MNLAPSIPRERGDVVDESVEGQRPGRSWRRGSLEGGIALLGFVVFAVLVLTHATALLEPDDYAYRASIVALSQGHILLSSAQYQALAHFLSTHGEPGIEQWHHLSTGKWISEKNPGYPFFAVLFYMAKVVRLAPLFYGALACVGLYHGARAWLGRWGGTLAVWAYCFSGAALVFAWRATMPSFSDASLIAAGAGGLLWTALRVDVPSRRRLLVGLVSFLALEGAVFIRYTDAAELVVAVLAVVVFRRAMRITVRTLVVWLASVGLFGVLLLAFNDWAYGHATSTGYSAGEITFSLSAFWPNLKLMPGQLLSSVPVYVVAALAVVSIGVNFARTRRSPDATRDAARRDLVVGAVLAASWLAMWVLYFNYTWTADMSGGPGGGGGGGGTVHLIRFYLPALGALALLAAWLLIRLPRVLTGTIVATLVLTALLSFHSMAGGGMVGGGGLPGSNGGRPPAGQGPFAHSPTRGRDGFGPPGGGRGGVKPPASPGATRRR
jgi:hypothetical protein